MIGNKIDSLTEELREANNYYYNDGSSLLTDEEYDYKRNQLKSLDPSNPLLKTIGAPVHGETIKHQSVMLSLDDFWNYDDLTSVIKEGDKKTPRELVPELKYDGIAVSIVYINGVISYAATRGDGFNGEVITKSALHVKGAPERLTGSIRGILEVRGEIVFPKEEFTKVATELKYANPRNATAGLIRRLDTEFLKDKGLVFIPYDVTRHPFENIDEYTCLLNKVKSLGIGINDSVEWFQQLQTEYLNGIISFVDLTNSVISKRQDLPFDIDGVVFKYNSMVKRKELGMNGRVPRWGIAFKFPGSAGITTLEEVEWQVSRNGRLTPVGKVSPVNIGGAVYTSVTLHNTDEISRLGVKLGDKILIERRGDVIPKIMKVVDTDNINKSILSPVTCPSCKSLIRYSNSDPYCNNDVDCHDQLYLKIVHFASRKAMNIEGLAESTASALVKTGMVTNICDLYQLSVEDISTLPGFAEQSSFNLFNAIQESKSKTLDKLIFGLGIRGIGESSAQVFSNIISSIENWLSYSNSKDELLLLMSNVPLSSLDLEARNSLVEYITTPVTTNILKGLIKNNVNPVFVNTKSSNKLEGKSFVITGSFIGFSRDDISKIITNNGGKLSSSVSKNTNYLIAGTNEGSKLTIALKLQTPVIRLTNMRTIKDVEDFLLTVGLNEEDHQA